MYSLSNTFMDLKHYLISVIQASKIDFGLLISKFELNRKEFLKLEKKVEPFKALHVGKRNFVFKVLELKDNIQLYTRIICVAILTIFTSKTVIKEPSTGKICFLTKFIFCSDSMTSCSCTTTKVI